MRQAKACRRRERSSYSLCMKVSKFQVENKSTTQRVYSHSALNDTFWIQKRRGVECIYLPEAFDCLTQINANNSRPQRPFASR